MDGTSKTTTTSTELLAAARDGNEDAFRALLEPHRRELHLLCYRMTGSVHDAEDVLQEVLVRAWRGLPRYEGRSSLRSWLYRIATNACLTALEQRSRRVHPLDHDPTVDRMPNGESLTESPYLGPYPDEVLGLEDGYPGPEARYEQRESVELAFVAALQHLPANQRAALILREVLGFSARDAATALETTTAAVNSALQHARKTIQARVPERSQQATLRELGDRQLRALVDNYTSAMERGDIHAIIAMLAEDATWSMPPFPEYYRGHQEISTFLLDGPFRVRWRHVPTRANGQAAVGCYSWDATTGRYIAHVIDVLTFRGPQIAAITAFIDPELFTRFDLPEALPPD